ncbi:MULTISPECIES: hypothetical protein [Psychrobacillus]|uniref:hypothetical protein n=1 Tax=Psychrobacillus TaxID=1221880 RepID=UPI00178C6F36|nr:hypothetical protein [Psychrobacillus glaciei]
MGLIEHHVTMKITKKRLNSLPFTYVRKKAQTSLQWIILKKARPPKLKYIPIPPRK